MKEDEKKIPSFNVNPPSDIMSQKMRKQVEQIHQKRKIHPDHFGSGLFRQ